MIKPTDIFPVKLFTPGTKVLSLCSAGFMGIHDVTYLYEYGVKDVMMVDIEKGNLEKMAQRYGYQYHVGDMFKFILNNPIKYDIIICDQWTNMDEKVWAFYEELKKNATQYLIISIVKEYNSMIQLPPGELIKRSDYLGGVYWHITKIKRESQSPPF